MNIKTPKTLIDVLKHLYKLADDFPYSQLALCLDQKNLFDLLRVFGGQSLYIPTVDEFTSLIQFCIVEEVGSYSEAVEINKEALRGFSETKYNRILEQLRGRAEKDEDQDPNHLGETGEDNRRSRKKRRKRRDKESDRG